MDTMSDRLRKARIEAGFKRASEAVRHHGWKTKSTYIAHENGQNNYDPEQAAIYGKAFKVAPEWLLFGRQPFENKAPGIDRQLLELPTAEAQKLTDRFNAMIEGVKAVQKVN